MKIQNEVPWTADPYYQAYLWDLGIGRINNKKKALSLFIRSAKDGNLDAQFEVATRYHNGIGTRKNIKKAIFWYETIALRGFSEAYYNLGVIYETEKNRQRAALQAYEKAARLGDCDAQFRVAYLCDRMGQPKKAHNWYLRAALRGNVNAQFNLALLLESSGKGGLLKARFWYKKAAKTDSEAANNLAISYVEENMQRAVNWFTKGASMGDSKCLYNLGVCYENGLGVRKDLNRALDCYLSAGSCGNNRALARVRTLIGRSEPYIKPNASR